MELKKILEDIRKKRVDLEEDVRKTFLKFTEETGLSVTSVDVSGMYEVGKDGEPVDYRVKVNIILD